MPTSGIYTIFNEVSGKTYVGGSFDIVERWRRHKSLLTRNKHHNYHLQQAWNKYGPQSFKFTVEEIISRQNLLEIEQQYLDVCKILPTFYYNTCYVAGAPMKGRIPWNKGKVGLQIAWNKGRPFSEESKQKMSTSAKKKVCKNPMLGKYHSEKTKQKMREAWKFRGPISEETRYKMSESHIKYYENIGT
jgi:group I intron endonuclease